MDTPTQGNPSLNPQRVDRKKQVRASVTATKLPSLTANNKADVEMEQESLEDLVFEISTVQKPRRKAISEKQTTRQVHKNSGLALLIQLDIYSNQRLRVIDCSKSLSLFKYKKQYSNKFGQSSQLVYSHHYVNAIALVDVFTQFEQDRTFSRRFYVIAENTVILFGHYEDQKYALIYGTTLDLVERLGGEGIHHHPMMVEGDEEVYAYLIRKRFIRVYWNYLMNSLLRGSQGFEVISNYSFTCSYGTFPIEVYNSKASNPKEGKAFHLKLQGCFLKENIDRVQKQFGAQGQVEIVWKELHKTSLIQSILTKGFCYESEQESEGESEEGSEGAQQSEGSNLPSD